MRHRIFIETMLLTAWLASCQPSGAQGTIAYYQPSTPMPLWIPPDSFDIARQLPFSFDESSTHDLTFAYGWVFIGVRAEAATRVLTNMDPPPNLGGSVAPLPFGFTVGPGSESGALQWFGRVPGAPYDNAFNTLIACYDVGCTGDFRGHRGYMGVELQRAGATHYGWILLEISDHTAFGSIVAWAWETRPGVPILAGAVPEPSAWALLAAGGGLLVLFGRSRKTD